MKKLMINQSDQSELPELAEPHSVLLITPSNEWLRLYSTIDWQGVDEYDEAAVCFTEALVAAMEDDFECEIAAGQLATCHGWHGANLFKSRMGPVASYAPLTRDQEDAVYRAIASAEDKMRSIWANGGIKPWHTGQMMPNGALVIADQSREADADGTMGETVVLAMRPAAGGSRTYAYVYVTWRIIDAQGSCVSGHYFNSLKEAVADFEAR